MLKPNSYIYVNDFLLNYDEQNLIRYDKYKEKYTYGVFELEEGVILWYHDLDYSKLLLAKFKNAKWN